MKWSMMWEWKRGKVESEGGRGEREREKGGALGLGEETGGS